MARRVLTDEEKERMKEGRKKSQKERGKALEFVGNPQLTSAKFWQNVDYETMEAIADAISKGKDAQKAQRIKELEAELAKLKAE